VSEWEPEEVVIQEPRRWGRFLVLVLAIAAVGGAIWYFRNRMVANIEPQMGLASHVRSDVSTTGDSLDVIVAWQFSDPGRGGRPDSVRVEVGVEGTDPHVDLLPGYTRADTLRLPSPAPGTTAMGQSCVSGVFAGRLWRETCTPWEFVRPSAAGGPAPRIPRDSAVRTRKTSRQPVTSQILRILVRPSGQQVDPDLGGRCAAWQSANPERSVWIKVNDSAVAECMGPNGKPTVAQFCAFAVLEDGSRVKTENSTNNPYCEDLFHIWVRERLS
jgi:hypothetical protein